MQFFCAQLEHTRDRVYFTNCCLVCGNARVPAELPAIGVVDFTYDDWRATVQSGTADAWGFTMCDPQPVIGQVVIPSRYTTIVTFGLPTCCNAWHMTSKDIEPAEICDAAIWCLAALEAMIVVRGGAELDCVAEQHARAERRARWRLSVYALLVLGDSCCVVPDVARQIVWLALPQVA